jgi:hypothetical protein
MTLKIVSLLVLAGVSAGCAARQTPDHAQEVAQACAGISDGDLTSVVDGARANVESVKPKYVANVGLKGVPATKLTGAVLYVRATPGTTAPSLTRALRCDGLKDHRVVPSEADVRTDATETGFAVSLESSDPAIARSIWARTEELTAHR